MRAGMEQRLSAIIADGKKGHYLAIAGKKGQQNDSNLLDPHRASRVEQRFFQRARQDPRIQLSRGGILSHKITYHGDEDCYKRGARRRPQSGGTYIDSAVYWAPPRVR